MEKFITDTWKEGGFGHYTHQEDMYMKYIHTISPFFEGGSVLEIGPGTGKFAKRLINKYSIKNYTVLDLEKNINDSINLLKDSPAEITPIFSQDYKELFDTDFDLVVSNVCIPETPKEYREDLLNNIIPNTKSAMIIGQLTGNWVDGNEYEKWIKGLYDNNFNEVKCELTPYANCYALTGNK